MTSRGFTLVELMVVIAIIAVFAGVFGLALSGNSRDGVALANAQTMVIGLVGLARAQAAVHQTQSRLVVCAEAPPAGGAARYLRALVVVREDPFGSGQFVAAGDHVLLPASVCIVPPAPVPASHLRAGVSWDNRDSGPVSTLLAQAEFRYRVQGSNGPADHFFGNAGSGRILYLEFDPIGTVTSNAVAAPAKLALATTVQPKDALPEFNNPAAVRGLLLRRSGAISRVDEATGF